MENEKRYAWVEVGGTSCKLKSIDKFNRQICRENGNICKRENCIFGKTKESIAESIYYSVFRRPYTTWGIHKSRKDECYKKFIEHAEAVIKKLKGEG